MIFVPPVHAGIDDTYTDSVEATHHLYGHVEFKTMLDTIRGTSAEEVEVLHMLLADLVSERAPDTLGRIARIEVFHEVDQPLHSTRRGLLVFNHRRQPLLHALNATLSISPSSREPNLTAKLLELVGAPATLFESAVQLIGNSFFVLAFTREAQDMSGKLDNNWRLQRLR